MPANPLPSKLPFDLDEYARRIATVRADMAARGIDLLICADPSNMAWLTGYDGWSFYTAQVVVLAAEGEPVWWGRNMDEPGARRTCWMDHANIAGFSDIFVMNPPLHAYQDLAKLVEARGWGGKTIGVEMDNYYYSAAAHNALTGGLGAATFVDATGLANRCRSVKSAAEIGFMRRAATIIDKTYVRILAEIEPGMRKCDLVAGIYDTSIRGTEEYGGDYPAIAPLVPSGADASAAHMTWDDSRFENNTGTFFELAGCYRRYHTPLCRTIYLGIPGDEWLKTETAILEGIDASLAAAKPGNTCHDVWSAWTEAISRHGLTKESRMGYGIGLSYPPDWGERHASFRKGDETVLEEGMTFHLMPAIWQDDWGIEITETFLVTAAGAECFCTTPRKLFVKP